MRKLVALSAAVLLVTGAFGGVASAGKGARQDVSGTILLPQGGNAAATCVYRAQRALYIAMGEQINGIFGYTFPVDPKTTGKPFKLDVTAGAGVDISFYLDLGTDPTADSPGNYPYETPGPGGEKGMVPAGYPNAFVCLTEGVNATFTYSAGKGVK